ncbi:CTP synthase [Erysipelothrix urinaevulpis]|uniref:CTP synthase n=1 Tax=Erysipelothrix urinaevulpis TaxID=2683717 RepID=UPI001358156F|nr:CTP synthase [Erysipelothrix urinaevulpis]
MTKYIFVTGGVVSGIGKGIIAASVGRLLKNRGLTVFMQKFDPYINVNPGKMSPYQHGEVFVTKDGAETDLDLGHYERFIDVELTQNASMSAGRVYQNVIENERQGKYEGATIQVIPHITDEIKNKVYAAAEESEADIVITEIGGTVGDIESLPFVEAVRQVHGEQNTEDVIFIHTTLIPKVPASNEYKTKPTQHSFKELMSQGVKANIIVTRCDEPLEEDMKKKIAMFCDVNEQAIIESRNVENLYDLPLLFQEQGLDDYILKKFKLDHLPKADMTDWKAMIDRTNNLTNKVKIALVGKYVQLHDAYLSTYEAMLHAGFDLSTEIDLEWINSEDVTDDNAGEIFKDVDGIIVPGGFGQRGIEGKIVASKFARENNLPFFGISLGMQVAAIDFARNVCGLEKANSIEMNPGTPHPIIVPTAGILDPGDSLRLGNHPCQLKQGTMASELYKESVVFERHRHRYEFNNKYREILEEKGLSFSGVTPDGQIVEIIELEDNDFYVGCQFHPEFKSRPNRSHPLFYGFIKASLHFSQKRVK